MAPLSHRATDRECIEDLGAIDDTSHSHHSIMGRHQVGDDGCLGDKADNYQVTPAVAIRPTHVESAFERVPPEIMNKILELVLIQEEEIELNHDDWRYVRRRHRLLMRGEKEPPYNRRWPAILSTCRRIREAGTPIYLGANKFFVTFTLKHDKGLVQWLDILHSLPQRWVRHVSRVSFCRTPVNLRSFRYNALLSFRTYREWKQKARNPDHRLARRGIGMPWF